MWICKQMLFSSIATILIALVGVSATVEKLCKKYMKNASIAKHFEILEKDKLTSTSKISLKFDCIKEDTECIKDKLSYDAISCLHRLIDDDHNGNVDQSESDEFLRDELEYPDGLERHTNLHFDDKYISVDDLWQLWKFSEVYNWTVEEVVNWLEKEVDLPQYSALFRAHFVTGSYLPRLAVSNNFTTAILGIRNPVHKQKLALKAMDVVLFGAPKRHSYVKDLLLIALLIITVVGCFFSYWHHRYSQEQINSMMKQMDSLKRVEEDLMQIQEDEGMHARSVSPHLEQTALPAFKEGTAVTEADLQWHSGTGELTWSIRAELAATRLALQQAEVQLENRSVWSVPEELQAWLQITYELEQGQYTAKRQAAERHFQAAKDSCDKIKRRNKAFFGSLRMVHSNTLDEIDERILEAKLALEEVRQDLKERLHRWHRMEQLCGFSICSNPGIPVLSSLLLNSNDVVLARPETGKIGNTSMNKMDGADSASVVCKQVGLPYTLYPVQPTTVQKGCLAGQRSRFIQHQHLNQHMAVTRVPSTVCLRQYAFNSSATPLYHPVRNMASGNNLAGMPPASSAALLYNADINMSGAEIKFHLGEELDSYGLTFQGSSIQSGGNSSLLRHSTTFSNTNPTGTPIPPPYTLAHSLASQRGEPFQGPQSQYHNRPSDAEIHPLKNGLDMVSCTLNSTRSDSQDGDCSVLSPVRSGRKQRKGTKLLTMFKKSGKQKTS